MADPDCVRVAIRIRPLVPSEREKGCQVAVERTPGTPQVTVNKTDAFTFNYVFDQDNLQEEVYQEAVYGMIENLFKGYNVTILAYGQTGSGKTHTMGTAFDGNLDGDIGVIPRAMNDIFARIDKSSEEYNFTVTCSFMELYQEQLFDLLSTAPRDQTIIDVREDRNGIIMPGLTTEVVHNAREMTDCLVRGSSGRAVASTAMNQQSSRSHAIFTITVQAEKKDEMQSVTTSKFHLVDLAGSERSKKTKATGDRFKEGVKINQGLLALGSVISALGSGNSSGFVSYRDSKLTRLLQDSLGGNSVTLMIACISPADYNVPETLSTLRYADRARKIKNKPVVNQDPHAAEINHLKSIIQKLRMELLVSRGSMSASLTDAIQTVAPAPAAGAVAYSKGQSEENSTSYKLLQEKYRNLQQQLQTTLHDVAENEMRAHIAEAAHEKLKTKTDEMKAIVTGLSQDVKDEHAIEPQKIEEIRKLVECMDEELEKTQSEITEHKRRISTMNGTEDDDGDGNNSQSNEMSALMQEQADAFTSKQMNFKEQLRRIDRELNLKEQLHQRVAGNFTKFCTLDDNIEEKFKDCEMKIQELEVEKSELLDKLKHVKENASAKLAEERRKRLQTLEQEINEMKRKNTQQAKLLKVREKETQKIKNLNTEIQAMKESKVKLIRAMRQESENFRMWKLTREKELLQLKNKDRKMQNEMARKEALHTKQRNVLKRKCEEAMAINKRLKDALERQKVAQSLRQKQQSTKDANVATNKIEQVISWLERELEVIISLIDADNSLEQLMEDRGIISNRIGELQQQRPEKNTPAAAELANLEEELEMRNAQIADLQQKVCATDLDTRMRSMCESIQSLAEARAVMKQLLSTIVDMRREYAAKTLEQKTAREAAEERCEASAKRMRLMEIEHEEDIAERENTYEEKIAVLLRELHNKPHINVEIEPTPEQQQRIQIQEEQLNRMDSLRDELSYYKKLVTDLQSAMEETRKRKKASPQKKKKTVEVIECIPSSSEDDEEIDNDTDNDPDWKSTPRFKRKGTHRRRNTGSDVSSVMDDTNVSAHSNSTIADSVSVAGKKKRHCGCRGNCSNKRCGCHSNAQKCTINCQCTEKCTNGKNDGPPKDNNGNDENKENKTANTPPTLNGHDITFAKPESSILTPKVARMSGLSFASASAKKKFFD